MSRFFAALLLLLSFSSFSQQPKNTISDDIRIRRLERQVNELQSKIDDIQNFKKEQEGIVKQTSQTISNQNSLLDSFGHIYTIITIIIAIIGVALPIITYQFGIKPSQEARKELEENLDNKVASFLKEIRSRQIRQSVKNLKGDDIDLKAQAMLFLSVTQHEGFSDHEFFEFYNLIKSGTLSDNQIHSMLHIIGSKVNIYADLLFKDKEILRRSSIFKNAAYMYMSKAGFEKFKPELIELLKDSKDNQNQEFMSIVSIFNMDSTDVTIKILNDKDFINVLNEETLQMMNQYYESFFQQLKIDSSKLGQTYFAKKMKLH